MRKYRVGIIGCGRMGWLFNEDRLADQPVSHAEAYLLNKKTEFSAVCDLDREKLKGISKKYDIKNIYTDYRKMLKKVDLDIVSIATPTTLHKEVCGAASAAGVRAIFCEKPIAASLEEADEMIRVCKRNKTVLMVNHTRRWDRSFNDVKGMLDKGDIGKVDLIIAFAAAGLMNSGTHLFDILRYYFGDVLSVSGALIPDGSTDPGGRGTVRFKNDILTFFYSGFREYVLFGANIYGQKGMIDLGGQIRRDDAYRLLKAQASRKESGIKELRRANLKSSRWTPPMLNAVRNIVNVLDNKEPPLCTGEDGMATVEVAMAFHESDREKTKKITLPLKDRSLRLIPRETSFTKNGRLE
ncbi:MAG: Gfo/Idh/MocA family oxidoreductase [Candidatus Omnitrophica bacterium]|nr:Gfo/Idh/MocA family oxidoreductase [Candidatus Omnitrophota bacterium]